MDIVVIFFRRHYAALAAMFSADHELFIGIYIEASSDPRPVYWWCRSRQVYPQGPLYSLAIYDFAAIRCLSTVLKVHP